MGAIICSVEENRFIHRITVRQYCENEELKKFALSIAVHIIEKANQITGLKVFEGEYVDNGSNTFSQIPFEVSYSVLYQDNVAKEKFMNLLKNFSK